MHYRAVMKLLVTCDDQWCTVEDWSNNDDEGADIMDGEMECCSKLTDRCVDLLIHGSQMQGRSQPARNFSAFRSWAAIKLLSLHYWLALWALQRGRHSVAYHTKSKLIKQSMLAAETEAVGSVSLISHDSKPLYDELKNKIQGNIDSHSAPKSVNGLHQRCLLKAESMQHKVQYQWGRRRERSRPSVHSFRGNNMSERILENTSHRWQLREGMAKLSVDVMNQNNSFHTSQPKDWFNMENF